MDRAATLEVRGVRKSFGPIEIIRGVDLIVNRGERHALIGPNGAGKSTLFNMISGLFGPSAGEIRFMRRRIDGLRPERINRLGLGRSFQITSIFPRLSAFENLQIAVMPRFGVRFSVLYRLDRYADVNARAKELLEAVRLSGRRDVPASELAYSEQRALEIALTLASDPVLILLDEPTSGMSRPEATHVIDLIRRVTQNRALLMVEHDMDVVFQLCDRISVLVYGRIIASGSPQEIRANAAVREAYLGSLAA
jgi:branched-chain amino acid transport system ATP-binding protein